MLKTSKVGRGREEGGQVAKGGEGEKGRQREGGGQVAEGGEGVPLCPVNPQVNQCVHMFQ